MLRNRITEERANIMSKMLRNTFENMKQRVSLCLHENGDLNLWIKFK